MNRLASAILVTGSVATLSSAGGAQTPPGAIVTASAPSTPDVASRPTDDSGQIEDIVVTARQRAESLMSVPVAVSAISASALAQSGATNLERIGELAPQVMITRASSGNGGIVSIRGLGTPALDASLEQSVSINIDGVQAGRGNLVNQGFFDLAQVEVLKGPQALFFGKNSPAGVISLRSVDPTDHLEGYAKVGTEFVARQYYGEAAVGGPLTSTLKARIAIRASSMDGWLRNTAPALPDNPFYPGFGTPRGPNRNGGDEFTGRVTLVYTPAPNFDATLKISGGTYKDNGATVQAYCPGQTQPKTFFLGVPDPTGDCAFDDRYANAAIAPAVAATFPGSNGGQPYTNTYATLTSLTMNYRLPDLTITSVTGFSKLRYDQALSFSDTAFGTTWAVISEDTTTVSQEVRAVSSYNGPLNFTLGGFYEHIARNSGINEMVFGSGFGADPATGKYDTFEVTASNDGDTLSAFGQLRWAFARNFEFGAGVRYTYEKKTARQLNTFVNAIQGAAFGLRPAGSSLDFSFTDDNWSPELTLSWKPVAGTLVYGAYKTGYKSGGISNPSVLSAIATPASLSYKSENSNGGEIGVKTFLAHRRVRIEATAYDYLYKNLQVSAFDQATLSSFLTNAASARIKGVELSGEWRATEGLRLNGSATYNSARYESYPNSLCYFAQTPAQGCTNNVQNLSGAALSRAPDWTFSGGGSYEVSLGHDLMIGVNADANYSSSFQTEEDHAPLAVQPGYTFINAGARLYDTRVGWEIAVIGRNLTDKYVRRLCNGAFSVGNLACQNTRAREVSLQGTFRF